VKTLPPPVDEFALETRQLYLHLLNLKQEDGRPATDGPRLHREIAERPELRGAHLDAAALARYISGDQEIAGERLQRLRAAVDQAYRKAVDPRFTWKPRWLNARQGMSHAHPRIPCRELPPSQDRE
jgi:hypothetical protein